VKETVSAIGILSEGAALVESAMVEGEG